MLHSKTVTQTCSQAGWRPSTNASQLPILHASHLSGPQCRLQSGVTVVPPSQGLYEDLVSSVVIWHIVSAMLSSFDM